MKKGTKRMLSILMMTTLAASVNPQIKVGNQIVYAQEEAQSVSTLEELQNIVAECNSNDAETTCEVALEKDITLTSALTLNSGSLILDLNDYNISGSMSGFLFEVSGGSLTVKDSMGSGSMSNTSGGAISLSSGVLNISGGTFRGTKSSITSSGGTMNLSGGNFSGTDSCITSTGGTANLSGGSFEGKDTCITMESTVYNITGGTYSAMGNGRNGCGLRILNNNQVFLSGDDTKMISDYGCIFLGPEFSGNTLSIRGGLYQTVALPNSFGYPCYIEGDCELSITGGTFDNAYSARSLVLGSGLADSKIELKGGTYNKGIGRGVASASNQNYTAFYGDGGATQGILGEQCVLTDNDVVLEGDIVHITSPVSIVPGTLVKFNTQRSALEKESTDTEDFYSLVPVSVGADGTVYGEISLVPEVDADKISDGNLYSFHGWHDENGEEYLTLEEYLSKNQENTSDIMLNAVWDAKVAKEEGFLSAIQNEKVVKNIELTNDITLSDFIYQEQSGSLEDTVERTLDLGGNTISYPNIDTPAVTLNGFWNLKNGTIAGSGAPALWIEGSAVIEELHCKAEDAPYVIGFSGGTQSKIYSGIFETTIEDGCAIKISGGSEADMKKLLLNATASSTEVKLEGSDVYLNTPKLTVSKASLSYIENGEECSLGTMAYGDEGKTKNEFLSHEDYSGTITVTGIEVDQEAFTVEGESTPKTLRGGSADTYQYTVSTKENLPVGTYQGTIAISYLKEDGSEGVYQRNVSIAVEKKQLGISIPNLTMTKVYDGSREAYVIAGSLIGVVGDDEVRVTATARYEDEDAGSGKRIYISYLLTGADKGNYLAPENETFTGGVIEKARGEASVTIEDYCVGETAAPVAQSKTNGTDHVSWYYKKKGEPDSTYTKEAPTEEGSYTLKAVFAETKNYYEVEVSKDFNVSYLAIPKQPYTLEGTKGEDGWYVSKVTIYPAKGYLLSTEAEGSYRESYLLDATAEPVIYLKRDGGAVTKAIQVEKIQIDVNSPEISGIEDGKVYYEDNLEAVIQDENLSYVILNGEKMLVQGERFSLSLKPSEEIYTIVAKDKAGNVKECSVTVEEAWMKEGIIASGLKKLRKGKEYKLGSGQWTVAGDTTVYQGGSAIYVTTSGEYDFKKQ